MERWRKRKHNASFAFAESVTLFGLALKLLWRNWPSCRPFFAFVWVLIAAPQRTARSFQGSF